jgi:Flp pilus assembly pilin Flp
MEGDRVQGFRRYFSDESGMTAFDYAAIAALLAIAAVVGLGLAAHGR